MAKDKYWHENYYWKFEKPKAKFSSKQAKEIIDDMIEGLHSNPKNQENTRNALISMFNKTGELPVSKTFQMAPMLQDKQLSNFLNQKKGPKDITPETLDETAASFENLEKPKSASKPAPKSEPKPPLEFPKGLKEKNMGQIPNELADIEGWPGGTEAWAKNPDAIENMGKEPGPGFKKPRSYIEEKKIPPISIPEGKARVSDAGKKLSQFGEKLSEKAAAKTADFKKLYGGALDEIMADLEGGKFPAASEIPYNPEYTADLMTRAQKELGKAGKKAKEAITQKQLYTDLLGERLKSAAPDIVKPNKAPPFDMGFNIDEFGKEIPGRMEPPPIPKEAMTENLYDPKVWKEFAKEGGKEPGINWQYYKEPGRIEAPKGVPTAAERMAVGGTPKMTNWDEIIKAGKSGGPSTSIEGLENAIQGMISKGEQPISIMKEAASDAAQFMKKNKLTRQEMIHSVGKALPWLGWGLVAYEIIKHGPGAGAEMAAQNELPWVLDSVFGTLGTGEGENPQQRSSIYDYANLNQGIQG